MLLDRVLRFFIISFFAISSGTLAHFATPLLTLYISTNFLETDMGIFRLTLAGGLCILIGALLGGIIGHFLSSYLISALKRLSLWVEAQMGKVPILDVITGIVGLFIGLIIASLLGSAFSRIPVVGDYIPVVFSIVLGYLGIHIMINKRTEVAAVFNAVPRFFREIAKRDVKEKKIKLETANQRQYKLLDTSVIIDGRIADICDTGFIEGTLLIPVFVLEELQHIADSPDPLKRVRGRRGLDILQRIRKESHMKVEITEVDYEDIAEVDSKLLQLASDTASCIITNDYNLNKVAQLRNVSVLNINELANAVKPMVIPGETMNVRVVKQGKENGQGLAYLDDGTMIVVENGNRYIGTDGISVEVTSALQTAAGRMIFARPK